MKSNTEKEAGHMYVYTHTHRHTHAQLTQNKTIKKQQQ